MIQESQNTEASELGKLLLHMGTALMQASTGSSKVLISLLRVANHYGYDAHVEITIRSLSINLHRQNEDQILFNGSRSINMPGVNFNTLASISRLSWEVHEKSLSLKETKEALEQILKQAAYPRLLILAMVGLASAAFCYNFGGDYRQMLITFIASFGALWVKQELAHKHFNTFLNTFFSSCIAAGIVAVFHLTNIYLLPVEAFIT